MTGEKTKKRIIEKKAIKSSYKMTIVFKKSYNSLHKPRNIAKY